MHKIFLTFFNVCLLVLFAVYGWFKEGIVCVVIQGLQVWVFNEVEEC